MRGVPRYKVVLEEHSADWAQEFAQVREGLKRIHGDNAVDIQHVGSTAIEGIAAKPMLDIAIRFRRMNDAVMAAMAGNGYAYYGEVARGKHLFILRGEQGESLQHVHCYGEEGDGLFREQLRFRDFLRAHREYALAYEQLKRELCRRYADDRSSYTAGKQQFFDMIGRLAREEADER